MLSPVAKKVIGVEIIEEAVEAASVLQHQHGKWHCVTSAEFYWSVLKTECVSENSSH